MIIRRKPLGADSVRNPQSLGLSLLRQGIARVQALTVRRSSEATPAPDWGEGIPEAVYDAIYAPNVDTAVAAAPDDGESWAVDDQALPGSGFYAGSVDEAIARAERPGAADISNQPASGNTRRTVRRQPQPQTAPQNAVQAPLPATPVQRQASNAPAMPQATPPAEIIPAPRQAANRPVRRQALSDADAMPNDLQAMWDLHKRLGHIREKPTGEAAQREAIERANRPRRRAAIVEMNAPKKGLPLEVPDENTSSSASPLGEPIQRSADNSIVAAAARISDSYTPEYFESDGDADFVPDNATFDGGDSSPETMFDNDDGTVAETNYPLNNAAASANSTPFAAPVGNDSGDAGDSPAMTDTLVDFSTVRRVSAPPTPNATPGLSTLPPLPPRAPSPLAAGSDVLPESSAIPRSTNPSAREFSTSATPSSDPLADTDDEPGAASTAFDVAPPITLNGPTVSPATASNDSIRRQAAVDAAISRAERPSDADVAPFAPFPATADADIQPGTSPRPEQVNIATQPVQRSVRPSPSAPTVHSAPPAPAAPAPSPLRPPSPHAVQRSSAMDRLDESNSADPAASIIDQPAISADFDAADSFAPSATEHPPGNFEPQPHFDADLSAPVAPSSLGADAVQRSAVRAAAIARAEQPMPTAAPNVAANRPAASANSSPVPPGDVSASPVQRTDQSSAQTARFNPASSSATSSPVPPNVAANRPAFSTASSPVLPNDESASPVQRTDQPSAQMARFNPAAAADYSDAASFDDAEIAPSAAAVIPDVAGTAEAGNAFETVPPWTSAAPSASLQRQSAPNPINATAADDDFYNATPDTFDAPFDTDTGFDDSPDAFQTAAPLSDVPSATVRRQAVSSSDQAANDPQDSSADDSASVRRTADHPSARTVDPISRDNARAAAIFRAEQPATPDTALPTQGEAPTRARPQNARPAQGMADRPPIQRSVQPDQQTFADSVSPRMVQTDDASVYDAADDPFYGDEEYTRADTMAEFDQMYQSAARADTVAEFDQPYQSAARADVQRTANDDDWMADDDRYEVPFDSAPADFDNQRDYRQQPPSTIARDVQPSRENTPHAGTPTADVINVSQAAPVRRVTAADNDPDDGPEPSATFDPSADFADAPEHYQNDALPDISYSPVPPADNSAARAIQRYAAPDDYASFDVPTNVDSAPDQPPAAPTLNWPRLRRKARTAQPAAVDSTVQRQSAADQMALTLPGDTLSSDAVPADRSASPEEVDMLMLLGLPPTARIERGPAQVVEAPAEAVQRSSQAGVQRLISEPTSSPSANDGGFTSVNPNEGMNPTSSTVMANNPLQQTESISRDDVEQIAQEVYRQLRNRLRIERERTKGGS